jgi:hypothetical protein
MYYSTITPQDMKRNDSIYFFTVVLLIIIGQTVAFSQANVSENQSKKYQIILKDGSTMQGTIISENAQEIDLTTENLGKITIKRDQIKSMVLLDSKNLRNGKYWFPNPNYSRYFIGPGIQLKKGDGYYQNVDLFLNTASYGITNFFSMGGGIELYSTLSGHPIFILMPKLGFKVANSLWLGGGILYVNAIEALDDFGGLGIGYGSAAFGNENNNVTLGIGWGYAGSSWSDRPIITLSGMTRVTRRIGLVTENWFIPDYTIFSYGIRFMGEKIAVDIGLLNSKDIVKTFPIGVPAFLDFVLKF